MRTLNTLKCVLAMQTNSRLFPSIPGLMGWILDGLDCVYTSKKLTSQDISVNNFPASSVKCDCYNTSQFWHETINTLPDNAKMWYRGEHRAQTFPRRSVDKVVLFWGGNTFSSHKVCCGTYPWDWDLSCYVYCRNQLSICRAGSQMCRLGLQWSVQPKMKLEWIATKRARSWTPAFFTNRDQDISELDMFGGVIACLTNELCIFPHVQENKFDQSRWIVNWWKEGFLHRKNKFDSSFILRTASAQMRMQLREMASKKLNSSWDFFFLLKTGITSLFC